MILEKKGTRNTITNLERMSYDIGLSTSFSTYHEGTPHGGVGTRDGGTCTLLV